MNSQPNRLSAEGEHRFKGSEIDRSRPLGFRLDGREIRGFAGDTLLSALLASGIVGAGTHDGDILALDERFAPPVLLRGHTHDRLRALSLERTPAVDGLDLVTLRHARFNRYGRAARMLRALLPGRRAHLAVSYDDDASLMDPWFDAPPERDIAADLVIVGAGLAGMSAALAAAKRGGRVVIVERRRWLGGEMRFFGADGDARAPDATVGKLTEAMIGFPNITLLEGAEAFAVSRGTVRVNQVILEDGVPASRALTITAQRIVLANGSLERLPIFAGNRRPGVVGALSAFDRADRFGVWVGRRAMIGTANNLGYRVAMPAIDAGIALLRVADTRLNPQSRFVEFAKAYGIAMSRSLTPREAKAAKRGGGLVVDFDYPPGDVVRPSERYAVDQLIISGGWQPDLTLWHMAGGISRWSAANNRLEAEGGLEGIVLAGSVAGYHSASACIKSGQAAVAILFGRSPPDVEDPQIEAIYETPDDPTPIGTIDPDASGNTYLDSGTSLAARPTPVRRWQRASSGRRARQWGLAEQARPLSVADVAAGVQLGVIPPDEAAIVAQERCVTPGDIVDAGRVQLPGVPQPAAMPGAPPAYLAGRYGAKPVVWLVEPADGRMFEPGCLVYANADPADPLAAIGVVFAPPPPRRAGGLAIVQKSQAAGSTPVVRDISGPIPVQLIDPSKLAEVTPMPAPAPSPSEAVAAAPVPAERVAATEPDAAPQSLPQFAPR